MSRPEVVNKHGTITTERGTVLYGMDHELFVKLQGKEDPAQVRAVAVWIARVTGKPLPRNDDLHESLRDGVILCELANKLRPGVIPVYNKQAKHMLHQQVR
eukprot:TRINITY_DN2276_c0_g1_i1.p3 TRINITY_DN2276_c0_g1~~TRINITY_DN2276_c0_g1_i1.p3  ORF type:complete len:101 (+),score=25.86 TRINITY_DN2276_c0_g1_i1:105-407(+)